jgi:hypothetical protein
MEKGRARCDVPSKTRAIGACGRGRRWIGNGEIGDRRRAERIPRRTSLIRVVQVDRVAHGREIGETVRITRLAKKFGRIQREHDNDSKDSDDSYNY